MHARSSGGNYDSGSQSLKELVNPTLTVTVAPYKLATAAAKTFEVQVFHKVLLLSTDAEFHQFIRWTHLAVHFYLIIFSGVCKRHK